MTACGRRLLSKRLDIFFERLDNEFKRNWKEISIPDKSNNDNDVHMYMYFIYASAFLYYNAYHPRRHDSKFNRKRVSESAVTTFSFLFLLHSIAIPCLLYSCCRSIEIMRRKITSSVSSRLLELLLFLSPPVTRLAKLTRRVTEEEKEEGKELVVPHHHHLRLLCDCLS